jgi:plastocyanin
MKTLLKRALPIAVVFAVWSQGSALAFTRDVSIANFFFSPKDTVGLVGDTVRWTNTTPDTPHTSTHDNTDPLVWDSGIISPGGTFSFQFKIAGMFTYHCNVHPFMMGSVALQPTVQPPSGRQGTVFAVQVATIPASGSLIYDVQIKLPGGQFMSFPGGSTSGRFAFNSTGRPRGQYQVRSRLRDMSNGQVSGYSPPVTFTVT